MRFKNILIICIVLFSTVIFSIFLFDDFKKENILCVLNVETDKMISIPSLDYYYEQLLCIKDNICYTVFQDYKTKEIYIRGFNTSGEEISKKIFNFNRQCHLVDDSAFIYEPLDEKLFYICSNLGSITLYMYDILAQKEKIIYSSEGIRSIKLINEEEICIMEKGKEEYIFHIMNIRTGVIRYSLPLKTATFFRIGPLSHKADKIILYGEKIIIVNLSNTGIIQEFEYNVSRLFHRQSIVWSPDDSMIALIEGSLMINKIMFLNVENNEIYAHPLLEEIYMAGPIAFYNNKSLIFSTPSISDGDKIDIFLYNIFEKKIFKEWKNFKYVKRVIVTPPYLFINTIP